MSVFGDLRPGGQPVPTAFNMTPVPTVPNSSSGKRKREESTWSDNDLMEGLLTTLSDLDASSIWDDIAEASDSCIEPTAFNQADNQANNRADDKELVTLEDVDFLELEVGNDLSSQNPIFTDVEEELEADLDVLSSSTNDSGATIPRVYFDTEEELTRATKKHCPGRAADMNCGHDRHSEVPSPFANVPVDEIPLADVLLVDVKSDSCLFTSNFRKQVLEYQQSIQQADEVAAIRQNIVTMQRRKQSQSFSDGLKKAMASFDKDIVKSTNRQKSKANKTYVKFTEYYNGKSEMRRVRAPE